MIYIKNKAVLPDCPYCGAKLGYFESFVVKNRSVYKCKNCDNRSSVDLKDIFYNALWIVLIICVVIFIFATLIGGGFALFGLSLILIVFIGFYGVSPYMVMLKKSKIKSEEKKDKKKKNKETDKETDKSESKEVLSNRENKDLFSEKDIFSN